MELGRVIGRLQATRRTENLSGAKLLIVQPLDENLAAVGAPVVAVDSVQAGPGDIVYWVKGREGAMVLPEPWACVDAGIAGIVDSVDLERPRGKRGR